MTSLAQLLEFLAIKQPVPKSTVNHCALTTTTYLTLAATLVAELGVAFQPCTFFPVFEKAFLEEKKFHLFYLIFSILFQKKGETTYFQLIFKKCISQKIYFEKKPKFVTFCHRLGNACVNHIIFQVHLSQQHDKTNTNLIPTLGMSGISTTLV